jgi:hypothetical protein
MGTDIGTTARAAPGGRRRRAGTLTSRVDAAGSGTASEPSPPNPVAARIRAQTPRRCPGRPHFWEQRPHCPAGRPRDGVRPNGATPTRATWHGESESRHQESPWAPFAQKGRCAEPRLPAAAERRPLGRRERQADESPARRSHPGLGNICRQPMRIGGNSPFFLISHRPRRSPNRPVEIPARRTHAAQYAARAMHTQSSHRHMRQWDSADVRR